MMYGKENENESTDEIEYETGKMETKQNQKIDDDNQSSRLDALQADQRNECFGPRIWRGCQASKNSRYQAREENAGEFQVR